MATVLIVDDNADMCRVLARLVRCSGHAADVALGGQEAMEYLHSHRPDLVILDIMMPRIDGLDVLQAIRREPRTSDVPVIMFTAAGEGELRERALRHGANAYLVKGTLDVHAINAHLAPYLGRPC